ncbi:hypothetical protein ACV229_12720 [Burkholderia sp. MR1-5-21]
MEIHAIDVQCRNGPTYLVTFDRIAMLGGGDAYVAQSDMLKLFGRTDLKLEKRNEAAKPDADERGGRGALEVAVIGGDGRTAMLRFGRGGARED